MSIIVVQAIPTCQAHTFVSRGRMSVYASGSPSFAAWPLELRTLPATCVPDGKDIDDLAVLVNGVVNEVTDSREEESPYVRNAQVRHKFTCTWNCSEQVECRFDVLGESERYCCAISKPPSLGLADLLVGAIANPDTIAQAFGRALSSATNCCPSMN